MGWKNIGLRGGRLGGSPFKKKEGFLVVKEVENGLPLWEKFFSESDFGEKKTAFNKIGCRVAADVWIEFSAIVRGREGVGGGGKEDRKGILFDKTGC